MAGLTEDGDAKVCQLLEMGGSVSRNASGRPGLLATVPLMRQAKDKRKSNA